MITVSASQLLQCLRQLRSVHNNQLSADEVSAAVIDD